MVVFFCLFCSVLPSGFFIVCYLVPLTNMQKLSALVLLLLSTYTRDQASQGLVSFHFHQVCFALSAV